MNLNNIQMKLSHIYSKEDSSRLTEYIQSLILEFRKSILPGLNDSVKSRCPKSQEDILLISYANTITGNEKPLHMLYDFIRINHIDKTFKILHIMPFYPWDTDRGFSIKDYFKVHSEYGDWEDINEFTNSMELMFDFVVNHASIDNPIVQSALISQHLPPEDIRYKQYARYRNFVITFSDDNRPTDTVLQKLSRPRPHPVLTRYTVIEEGGNKLKAILGFSNSDNLNGNKQILGTGWVWTTFSRSISDEGFEETRQVDLNFSNPMVFLEIVKILLFYIGKGSSYIRLDAIGAIWKVLGQSSFHEKEVHIFLEVIHDILSMICPGVITIAEVNDIQEKAFEYLGHGKSVEADLVYQFTHFPLAVHAVLTGKACHYMKWLNTMEKANGRQLVTVFGSHDGMGLKPVMNQLSESEIQDFIDRLVNHHGALPNYAVLPGGKKIVYEICGTPWDLINNPNNTDGFELQLARYKAVLSLGLIVRGIPAIYINGLLGTHNYKPNEGLDENRTINREIFKYEWLQEKLNDSKSAISRIREVVIDLLNKRANEKALNPSGPPLQTISVNSDSVVSVLIQSPDQKESILAIVNVSGQELGVSINNDQFELQQKFCFDIISQRNIPADEGYLNLLPYQVLWLKIEHYTLHSSADSKARIKQDPLHVS